MKRKVKRTASCWRLCGGRFGTPMVPWRRSRAAKSRGWMIGARRSHTTGTWPGWSSARRYAGAPGRDGARGEKVVSLFEPHTDIIRKGGRRVQYGHKVNLGSGASGLVFDAVVEAGNPATARAVCR